MQSQLDTDRPLTTTRRRVIARMLSASAASLMIAGCASSPDDADADTTTSTSAEDVSVSGDAPTSAPGASTPAEATGEPASGSGAGTLQDIEGASVWVPDGWTAYEAMHPDTYKAYCITPAGGTGDDECRITFAQMDPPVDADIEGGLASDPQYCAPSDPGSARVLQAGGEELFGGRIAEFRHWSWTCGDGTGTEYAQYVSPELNAYALTSEHASAETLDMMQQIAANSTLPAATGTVRLYDYGKVTAVIPDHDGYDVQIDRLVPNGDSPIDLDSQTYSYYVPSGATGSTPPYVGAYTTVTSDGTTVTATASGEPRK